MKELKIEKIKLKDIKHLENSRMRSRDDVSDLMGDIEQRGLLEPIGIRAKDNALIFGNRRVLAYEKLGYNEIEAIFYEDVSDEELLIINLAENIKRKNIGSIEIGRICNILEKNGMTRTEISLKLGISKMRVNSCMLAHKITLNTPFEKLIVEGKGGSRARSKGIPDGLIWQAQNSLSRALKWQRITKQEWDILLRAMETGKLNQKNLSVLRNFLMGNEDKSLKKAIDLLDKVKIVYAVFPVDMEKWYKVQSKEKISNDVEFVKRIIDKNFPGVVF